MAGAGGPVAGADPGPEDGFMRLACFDPATGQEVGDYTAISRALDESQGLRADAERRADERPGLRDAARAEEAGPRGGGPARRRTPRREQARADAERRARRCRPADAERARADAERARADAERRAQADATALAEALARIRELEARTDRSGRMGP